MSNLDSLLQTAIASHQAGEFSTASAGYARVLSADPSNSDAWHLAGLLAHQNGRSADGIQQIQLAIELNPQKSEYFSNLASILNSLERYSDALAAAERSLVIDDSFAPGYYQKGHALLNLNRLQDALDNFERAVRFGFSQEIVLRDMALVKQYAGDREGAIADLEQALKLNPRNPQAFFQLSKFVSTGDYSFTKAQLELMQRLARNNPRNEVTQNRLHVTIAIHYERNNDFDRAFQYFQTAGDLIFQALEAKGVTYQEQQRTEIIDDLVDFFRPSLFDRFRDAGNASKRPIFIVGMPRSGTTLLEQILAGHPSVSGVGELTDFGRLINEKFGDAGEVRLRETFPAIDNQWIKSAANEYLNILDGAELNGVPQNDKELAGVQHVIDKMPENYLHVGFIRLLFPEAAIVSCLRDPRDICLSCFCQAFNSQRLQLLTSNWNYLASLYRQYARLMNHWTDVLPERIYRIVYENLLDNPQRQIEQLLAFLGLQWDDSCLDFHQSRSQVKTASVAQVRKPLYQSSRNKWKRYEQQMSKFNSVLEPEIESFLALQQQLATPTE